MRRPGIAAQLLAPTAARAEGPPLRIALFASFPPMAYRVPETGALAGIASRASTSALVKYGLTDNTDAAAILATAPRP